MKILLLHEITEKIMQNDFSQFDIITFDDGLVSQFWYYKDFLKLNKPLFFFISTGIVNQGTLQNNVPVFCADAHELFFKKHDLSNYMNWDQIHELKERGCIIGGHSHTHPNLKNMSKINALKKSYDESFLMLNEFKTQNIIINSFSYPYNDFNIGYSVLKKYGIKNFFGNERIEILNF